ncbi:virion structural protein [Sulfolobus islandicus filamentous virus]|uniref:Major capsid protein 1 n=1 Tax=Sulfolobus islandicus filamentous virus (isolate Iceland/Hveragerdi) TaxID=654908 RepID=CAPS1_SIFVH|nr:virion structural protein [Sulfolobus islandicus filamentous virus]Q914J4.1 RecName: Full=Major capsid protein 1; AltName: Full=MCP1 [Sulfolobus islandicus filamentous virus (isolate Hveragerdi)]6WQ2_a Chain a, Structural protein MCP1 [Sulfolobus islandicus filamentous virus]6WQ2_b Chain b, Structural protein MCP1 [Sulfolobus islandicus filamentous virus]6WQ2_c Chain c, Structural protein MCP1 [Sulfolobus islandicus filamentous virus]6WQ2_d Chain d, Structural protein MCP1 [Sulfolobus islan
MAGRQSHKKIDVRNDTSTRYKGKLYGIFVNYMGEKYAQQLVENMYSNYNDVFVEIYNKMHNALRPTLVKLAGAGATFPLWQLVNEAIYAVYLTHKETASFLVTKYVARGVPAMTVKTLLAEVGNQLKELVPAVAEQIGSVTLDHTNVVSTVDNIVTSMPALPNSYAGVLMKTKVPTVTPHYAGTGTFSSMESAYKALEDIERGL